MLCIAVGAAVHFFLRISQPKGLNNFLLNRSNAARVFTGNHIFQLRRQGQMHLALKLPVFNPVNSNIAVDITEDIKIQGNILINLNNIFLSIFGAADMLNDRHRAGQLIQPQ